MSSHLFIHLLTIPLLFFFFNDTATTEIYTLSLHDALPIWSIASSSSTSPNSGRSWMPRCWWARARNSRPSSGGTRSEEHTSELQSPCNLVCRLLLEKKKTTELSSSETSIIPTRSPVAVHRR